MVIDFVHSKITVWVSRYVFSFRSSLIFCNCLEGRVLSCFLFWQGFFGLGFFLCFFESLLYCSDDGAGLLQTGKKPSSVFHSHFVFKELFIPVHMLISLCSAGNVNNFQWEWGDTTSEFLTLLMQTCKGLHMNRTLSTWYADNLNIFDLHQQ